MSLFENPISRYCHYIFNMLSNRGKCYLLLTSLYRRAAEKESHGEISLEDHNPSLAIANSAYTTINDASKLKNP